MSIPLAFLFAMVALAIGIALGRAGGAGRAATDEGRGTPQPEEDGIGDGAVPADVARLRSQALDASREAILIVAPDGRVRDCNAAALGFFDRHRAEVVTLEAVALRRLFAGDGRDLPVATVVASRAPWMGDGLARLPDGSTRECLSRAIPLFDASGAVEAIVEVHRDPLDPSLPAIRAAGLPHAALLLDADAPDQTAERRDLRFLAAAFHDLDRVVRQYQRLLPAMRAEDPLSEVIAGVAAETTEVAQAVDVPTLLREIPRALGRLDAHVRERDGE